MNKKRKYYFLFLIVALIQFRFFPHPPNFTPVIASGIVMGYFLKNFYTSLFFLIFSVFLGDIFFGFHITMFFVYLSLIIPVVLGIFIKNFNYRNILISGLIASFSFYLITNFGVWALSDMYSKTFQGLLECYTLALPFFSNTVTSTLIVLFLIKILLKIFKIDYNQKYIY